MRSPAAALLVLALASGCSGTATPRATPEPSGPVTTAAAPTASAPPAPSTPPAPGTTPPSWLGTRVLPATASGYVAPQRTPRALRERRFTLPDPPPDVVPPLAGRGFASDVVAPAPAAVLARSTWQPACPVAAEDLAWVRVAFRGFDGARHTGELLVASRVADDVVVVFGDLWRARFPVEAMRITTAAELDAPPTGDGNTTGAFVCRPVRGSTSWSQHALGLAVDVDPFQNPYERQGPEGRVVLPELATAYLDRDDVRPGMITPDGPVVRAFAAVGWSWGGDCQRLRDYQHFSLTGG